MVALLACAHVHACLMKTLEFANDDAKRSCSRMHVHACLMKTLEFANDDAKHVSLSYEFFTLF